ncbi:MAG: Smr/MutS family protein [Ignavibacteria bacterium]|jgi:DNA mismatch repair protein MutS2|nr:Smr/MutS family protein [Ignavibacteria bacterium]
MNQNNNNNIEKNADADVEEIVANSTFDELEFSEVKEYIAKKCLTSKGRELILSALPITSSNARFFFDNARIGDGETMLQNENSGLLWLNNELAEIDEMVVLLTSDKNLPIENIDDVREILQRSRVDGTLLSAAEIVAIYDVIRVAMGIKSFLRRKLDKYPLLSNEVLALYDSPQLQKRISDTIDDSGEIKDTATKALQHIRQEILTASNRLRSRMHKIVRQFSDNEYTQDDFYTVRDGRFVLPIKAEHKRHLGGIIHGASQTGSTVYLEPSEVIEMNNEISLLKSEEQNEIYNILKALTKEIAMDAIQLIESYGIIGHIDAIHSKATYALSFGGIKPEILDSNEVFMSKVYHPILVQRLGKKNVVPLSISFNTSKRGHLISGPNAGGKTVALKSIGLNIILATSGFFPIGEVKTCPLRVYSAIGDHQSIENNLSTFSSQLLNMKRILDIADHNSLVLIDEICSGTDPREGSALAAGILDTFIELHLFFVVTTHQSSLKTYALNPRKNEDGSDSNVIQNGSFEFDEVALKPTYNFLSGIPGNSYAFFLARNVGLARNVLSRAKKYLGGRTKQLERSIAMLGKYKHQSEEMLKEANAEKLKYEGMKRDYENRKKEFVDKKKQMLDEAKLQANEILQKANALVENTIRQIKEEKRKVSEVKSEFDKTQKEVADAATKIKLRQAAETSNIQVAEELNTDDSVGMLDNSEIGRVLEADNDAKTALVAFNGMKFRLPYSQLFLKEQSHRKPARNASPLNLSANTKLDLRGFRVEEAINATTNFLAAAVMQNVDFVTIIHGKGTGAMRQCVHQVLRDTSGIKSWRLGEIYEGGSGATIAYLK